MTATTAVQQDPIFDHTNGQKTAITTSAIIFTPSATCFFAWFTTDAAIVINTNNAAAADDGSGVYLASGSTQILPVSSGIAVFGLSITGTANVRVCGMKIR